jgi:hypothetical protein
MRANAVFGADLSVDPACNILLASRRARAMRLPASLSTGAQALQPYWAMIAENKARWASACY